MNVSNSNSNLKDQNERSNNLNKANDIIVKPIVYGSVAFWLGKKAEETVSHKWCVYVRGLNNEDISYFVKEVVFTLHSSFTNHVRVVNKFPFELYEVGWGQFDIIITIHLVDETAKPIEFVHPLKLYPSQPHASMSTKKPVVSESYDEIIFVNPEPHLKEILLNPPIQKKESAIQIPMNVDDERKSPDYSLFSQEDRGSMMQIEKADKIERHHTINPQALNLKRDPSFKLSATFENKFDNMNLATQMDVTPSQFNITPSFQQKLEDLHIGSTMGNYKISNTFMGDFENMNMNPEMNIDSYQPQKDVNQNADTISMLSNSMMDPDKKGEDKRSYYIPNIQQYYLPVDDSAHYKILEDANKFVMQEITRLKKQLEDTDKDINNVKKNIKEVTSKLII